MAPNPRLREAAVRARETKTDAQDRRFGPRPSDQTYSEGKQAAPRQEFRPRQIPLVWKGLERRRA